MDQENLNYLNSIAEKVTYYFKVKNEALEYIFDNKIADKELTVNLLLMSAVWASHQIGDSLTGDDLLINFGLYTPNDEEIWDDISSNIIELESHNKNLTLDELLEMTIESFK